MELIKLYRGNDNHVLALHKDSAGRHYITISFEGQYQKPVPAECELWMSLDYLEHLSLYSDHRCEPVGLLVSQYNGLTRRFETPDELYDYYSTTALPADQVRHAVSMLSRGVPVLGTLTAYREQPSRFTGGITALCSGYGLRVRQMI